MLWSQKFVIFVKRISEVSIFKTIEFCFLWKLLSGKKVFLDQSLLVMKTKSWEIRWLLFLPRGRFWRPCRQQWGGVWGCFGWQWRCLGLLSAPQAGRPFYPCPSPPTANWYRIWYILGYIELRKLWYKYKPMSILEGAHSVCFVLKSWNEPLLLFTYLITFNRKRYNFSLYYKI